MRDHWCPSMSFERDTSLLPRSCRHVPRYCNITAAFAFRRTLAPLYHCRTRSAQLLVPIRKQDCRPNMNMSSETCKALCPPCCGTFSHSLASDSRYSCANSCPGLYHLQNISTHSFHQNRLPIYWQEHNGRTQARIASPEIRRHYGPQHHV